MVVFMGISTISPMVSQKIGVRQIEKEDIDVLWALVDALGHVRDVDYFYRCFELQAEGKRLLFVAALDGQDAGYCILNWVPKYGLFQKIGIPEIQDLNVVPELRRQGVGAALINHCEAVAKAMGHDRMGIGVGLERSYGAAQRLYVRLGYIPDGNGATYDRKLLSFGESRPLDDNLCLMMTKNLA